MRARLTSPFVLLLLAGALASAQSTNTIPSWNGTSLISSFGVTNTATYGQTFTVTGGSGNLQSFSFEIGNCSAAVNFRGHIYAWNGTQATGAALYNSGIQSVAADATFHLVTFNTGALALPAGQYVLFASTSEDQGGAPNSACQWGAIADNTTYAGGQFVFLNNGTVTAQWTGNAWSTFTQDLAFSTVFSGGAPVSGVPTLSEWGMILLSMLLVGAGYFLLRSRSAVAVQASN